MEVDTVVFIVSEIGRCESKLCFPIVIVTTDVPGCRDIVRDGDNGILVPPRDSKALANALVKLINEPDLRSSMGKRGRERILNEFSQEIILSQVLTVYRIALN